MNVYLLSCETPEKGGGIGKYELTQEGKLHRLAFSPYDRPMYAVKCEKGLRVLLRAPFQNNDRGGYLTVDRELTPLTKLRSTRGKCPCHVCVDGKDTYVVNYLSGNLVKNGKTISIHHGKGVNAQRQDMPHTHCAFFSPDKQQVLCCDLGLDTLFCYDRNLKLFSSAKTPDGYGIRHALFSKNGSYVYALSEMIPAIHVFSFERGNLAWRKKYDIPCEKEKADGAAIRLSEDGKRLYLSLRVENVLAVFAVDGENVELLQKTDCGGDSPRDFQIFGDKLIVTNEKSNNVVVFALEGGNIGEKVEEMSLPAPLCCV